MYCSRPEFFLIGNLLIFIALLICGFFGPGETYISDPELAAAELYTIDDSIRGRRMPTNLIFEQMASDNYGYDLGLARLFDPSYALYPDGVDLFISTHERVPDLRMKKGCGKQFGAAEALYGRHAGIKYTADKRKITDSVWENYGVMQQYYGLYRYAPYGAECYNKLILPKAITGELKTKLGIPLVILNMAIIGGNLINPRLGHGEDINNPDNLISGPNRVYLNDTQKELIENEEKIVYAKKMDEQIQIGKTKGGTEDDPRTLDFILTESKKAGTDTRNEVSEKHGLPYTRIKDRDGKPRPFNAKDRGHDREFVGDNIRKDRERGQEACNKMKHEQGLPYEKILEKIKTEKGYVAYIVAGCYGTYKFQKIVVLPPYRSKGEELVQDDPHPDDDVYGNGGY